MAISVMQSLLIERNMDSEKRKLLEKVVMERYLSEGSVNICRELGVSVGQVSYCAQKMGLKTDRKVLRDRQATSARRNFAEKYKNGKPCKDCGVLFPREAYPDKTCKCARCRTKVKVANTLGISVEYYSTTLAKQNNKCRICTEDMNPPHSDHCHKSGKFRGFLCSHCNVGLGHFRDRPDLLREAASYIEEFRSIVW